MRKFLLIFTLLALIASCSKDKDTSEQLPAWLQERIAADEKEIASNPQSGLDLGAWIQYTYQDSTFYEYHNLLMSSLPKVYHSDGTEVNFTSVEYTAYQQGKCCKKFVWKGKSYFED
jgi:hypothetical protein